MTSNFGARNDSNQPSHRDVVDGMDNQQPLGALDNLKRDRFELLSAYLDGEVTAAERRQVEGWLQNDPTVQRLYSRLLRLRQGMQSLPIPAPEQSAEQAAEQVFSRLSRRPKIALAWAGVAIAATFVGVLSNVFSPGYQSPAPQVAEFPDVPDVSTTALMIAVDRPVIEIPKAPISSPDVNGGDKPYESRSYLNNDDVR
ncbi:zf-HC2 domain-containing protein [Oculatella sp. FACHB-28]|uniref:anti-sigma factor family protein n=1 Tax=Cyanophyceae TaxID=3028117 RepID=UPI001686DBF7|nr:MULTISPECIES: zf-HC2 domain-containing protein [Cyanophyceae]MBD2056532.1 zf-HC2 domain-containing protein [Oculatella sp. FACHB-28]MBD2069104.1 zf-HC2 domain-containing protein [Leptolyngbya sp. FACHB-671]